MALNAPQSVGSRLTQLFSFVQSRNDQLRCPDAPLRHRCHVPGGICVNETSIIVKNCVALLRGAREANGGKVQFQIDGVTACQDADIAFFQTVSCLPARLDPSFSAPTKLTHFVIRLMNVMTGPHLTLTAPGLSIACRFTKGSEAHSLS